jgi:hypothetical protein
MISRHHSGRVHPANSGRASTSSIRAASASETLSPIGTRPESTSLARPMSSRYPERAGWNVSAGRRQRRAAPGRHRLRQQIHRQLPAPGHRARHRQAVLRPESTGFLLAGGAALVAQHLATRPTEDLDFFTSPETGHVPAAIRNSDGAVIADLAVNAPPDFPASETAAGPTLAPEELAGHKLLALFDRAAARRQAASPSEACDCRTASGLRISSPVRVKCRLYCKVAGVVAIEVDPVGASSLLCRSC